jgi:hypothetical protein
MTERLLRGEKKAAAQHAHPFHAGLLHVAEPDGGEALSAPSFTPSASFPAGSHLSPASSPLRLFTPEPGTSSTTPYRFSSLARRSFTFTHRFHSGSCSGHPSYGPGCLDYRQAGMAYRGQRHCLRSGLFSVSSAALSAGISR